MDKLHPFEAAVLSKALQMSRPRNDEKKEIEFWAKLVGESLQDLVRFVGDAIIDQVPETKREAQVKGRDAFDALVYRRISQVAARKSEELMARSKKSRKRF